MDVIVSDVDGTVLDVTARIRAALEEIGEPAEPDPATAADALRGRQRSRFFEVFLSERHTHLDEPVWEVIRTLDRTRITTGRPVVFLTGRPASMRGSTRKALREIGIPYQELILRPRHQSMMRTSLFKVQALQSRGYFPKVVFDDDREILAAIAQAFPGAKLHLVRGAFTTPWPE